MKRLKRLRIFNLIMSVLVAVFAVGYAFAWFITDVLRSEMKFDGSSASAYFAGGTGTEDNPYQISDRYHLYNLSWLQNTGRFCDLDGVPEKLYFELTANFNMVQDGEILWLPPIGNAEHPFVGVFNGNGKEISNLRITTDKSKLNANNDSPLQSLPDYEFSNAVGMFGLTKSKSSTNRCEIKNFILNNPVVEVASENTLYAAVSETDPKAAGIAIGYVDGLASSIGVRGGTITAQANYSTFNSILGKLASGIQSSVTGGGHTEGDGNGGMGAAYGSSFDVELFQKRIEAIAANGGASSGLPKLETDKLAKGEIAPLAVVPQTDASGAIKFDYSGADATEDISPLNIGYMCGNQSKVYQTKVTYADAITMKDENDNELVWAEDGRTLQRADGTPVSQDIKVFYSWASGVPKTFFKRTGDNAQYDSTCSQAMSPAEIAELPKNVQDILNDTTFYSVRLQQRFDSTPGDGGSRYDTKSAISYYGTTYNNVKLPNTGVWFKPKNAGKFRFVVYSGKDGENFTLYKLKRYDSGYNAFSREDYTSEEAYLQAYFTQSEYLYGEALTTLHSYSLPNEGLFYFEYDVDDPSDAEFVLNNDRGSGAYFLYLDIGAAATDEDVSSFVPESDVSAIDFIYNNVSIKQEKLEGEVVDVGNFIVSSNTAYSATRTSIYFEELKGTLVISFTRPEGGSEDGYTILVTATRTDSGDTLDSTVPTFSSITYN